MTWRNAGRPDARVLMGLALKSDAHQTLPVHQAQAAVSQQRMVAASRTRIALHVTQARSAKSVAYARHATRRARWPTRPNRRVSPANRARCRRAIALHARSVPGRRRQALALSVETVPWTRLPTTSRPGASHALLGGNQQQTGRNASARPARTTASNCPSSTASKWGGGQCRQRTQPPDVTCAHRMPASTAPTLRA